jgi:hypothetical protein
MNFARHSFNTQHMAIFTIYKLLTVLARKVRLWELRYLSGDKDVEPGLFVCYVFEQSMDVSKNTLFIFCRWKRAHA